MKAIRFLPLMLILTIAFAGAVSAFNVTIDTVEIDDVSILPNSTNRLDVERGEEIEVRIVFTAYEDVRNLEIEARITGYEFNDIPTERLSDLVILDAEANVTYTRKLMLTLSDDVEVDDYKLRITIAGPFTESVTQDYNFKVDTKRHALAIEDVAVYPGYQIKAGSALLVTVRLENQGQRDEDDVKVTVSLPDLGLSAVDYIDEIENDDDEDETEEIYLRIPRCTEAGTYVLKVEVEYNEGRRTLTDNKMIQVLENELCKTDEGPQTTVTIGSQLETIPQGGNAIFPITITNNAQASKSYTLSVQVPEGLSVKLSPTSTIVLDEGSTQTLYIFVTADKKAPLGAQVLTATLSAGTETTEQIALTANIVKGDGINWVKGLEIFVILLVVLLVIVGLIIGFGHLRGKNDQQPYY